MLGVGRKWSAQGANQFMKSTPVPIIQSYFFWLFPESQDEEEYNVNYSKIVKLLLDLKEQDGVQIKLANKLYAAQGKQSFKSV